ncbi:hypothetical protein [Enterococcus caccae]|uniref:Uncharacterized protein n=1 Tax=Enterococcus caccae ATCC BAA-1240 TaxID=1158612 RepID=R3U7Q0_9ENTE|nr:hypothetical protein [Enterococcus caccae]EOL49964.1 hypothetical protein UC7_00629 [Enterococcus caccae ATCC BAA-1240]EOT56304.1 hypothetical protein I580_03104 [Enterococcus caccae ATCC BAA-1240]OJG26515.1 hypothetical protein RU98_GL000571 [Enterococcus caccae]
MKTKKNLTERIYTIELLSGMIFYSLGILFVTPPTNSEFTKYTIGGLMILVLLIIMVVTILTNTEKLDERALNNFYKSSNITFLFILLFLLVGGVATYFIPIGLKLSPAIISFILAVILILHGSTFRSLEISGK